MARKTRTVSEAGGSEVAGKTDRQEKGTTGLLSRMRGLTVALCTPLDEQHSLYLKGLERLIERAITGGASCLFPLGWCGEQPLLMQSVREAVVRETCRIAEGRVPVMAGVSEQSVPRVMEQVAMAKDAGADLVLTTPPYSYEIPQELVYEFFKELMSACDLPLVVYQNYEIGARIELDTLSRLREIPGIVGVKAYVPFLELQKYFHQLHNPESFAVISGDECLYGAALFEGIRLYTMGGPGNLCPGYCTLIYKDALNGDWESVKQKQQRMVDFCGAVYGCGDTAYAAVKYVLQCLGVCSSRMMSPHRTILPEQGEKLDTVLKQFADVLGA